MFFIILGIKIVVFAVASRFDSSSAKALAQDQRNDVISNSVALICGLIGMANDRINPKLKVSLL